MNNLILIKQKFSERYTLTIESEAKVINASMKSKARLRWDFRVIEIFEDYIECELLLLENILLESNNPLTEEVAQLSNAFGRMYNELHLKIDNQGKITTILNIDLLISKWEETKLEMLKIKNSNSKLKSLIALNDNSFKNPDKLIKAIQGSEFFVVLFGDFYGKSILEKGFQLEKANFFNTVNLHWNYTILANKQLIQGGQPQNVNFQTNSIPVGSLSEDFYKTAYESFEDHIDLKKISASLAENGNYLMDPITGKIIHGELFRNEILESKSLYTKLKYSMISDSKISSNKMNVDKREINKNRVNILDL